MRIDLDKSKWTQKETEDFTSKGWRSRREGEFPPVASIVRPSDYDNDLDRGTIDYDPEWRNYSFHKVRIPANAVVRNCNFAQANPDTVAITVVGNPSTVTFIDCNLMNVRILPGWNLQGCNNCQKWLVEIDNPDFGQEGQPEKIEERVFIASKNSDLSLPLTEPSNIKKKRDF